MVVDVTYEATRRELQTDQGVIRYHEAGEGNSEILLLLHGSGPGVNGWRNFRGNLEFFAQTHHCYIVEFPGFGVSDPVDGHPVLTAGSSVIRFMDALGIASAAVIGNSMGGVVGVNLAIKHPDRISKLVTIGGVGPNLFSPSPSEGLRLLQEFTDAPDRDKLVRWLNSMVYDRSLVTEELPDGDLKISFAGFTGGYSAKGVLGRDELVTMEPYGVIPRPVAEVCRLTYYCAYRDIHARTSGYRVIAELVAEDELNASYIVPTPFDKRVAANVAAELGVDEVRAELMPEDKLDIVKELQAGTQVHALLGNVTIAVSHRQRQLHGGSRHAHGFILRGRISVLDRALLVQFQAGVAHEAEFEHRDFGSGIADVTQYLVAHQFQQHCFASGGIDQTAFHCGIDSQAVHPAGGKRSPGGGGAPGLPAG